MTRSAASFCLLLTCGIVQLARSANIGVLPHHPQENIAGTTYEALDVLQSYAVDRRNTDQPWSVFGNCYGLSGFREITHTDSGITRHNVSRPCDSVLRNCRYDLSMGERVEFCVSIDPYRRYDYMETYGKEGYGRFPVGNCPSAEFLVYLPMGVWYPCLCDCENSNSRADRYFSLLDVTSDNNKAVTGVRFRKVNHVFYIQIQEAELGWGKLVRETPKWKPVETIPKVNKHEIDYGDLLKSNLVYAVTAEKNTVLLDTLMADENEVITGVRFRQIDQDLRLEIQVTLYNDDFAKFDRNSSRWIHNDFQRSARTEWKLKSTKVPKRSSKSRHLSFDNQFVKFQVSDFETDLGQTTVPLIDTRDSVADDEHRSSSGVGIVHHTSNHSAGFLAFRVFYRFL